MIDVKPVLQLDLLENCMQVTFKEIHFECFLYFFPTKKYYNPIKIDNFISHTLTLEIELNYLMIKNTI